MTRVNSVFFVGNALTITDTQQYLRDRFNITDFTINQCTMDQHSLMARNIPDKLKEISKTKLINYALKHKDDANLQGQIHNCIKELEQLPNGHCYQQYFDGLDLRRNTNWRNIFMELAND